MKKKILIICGIILGIIIIGGSLICYYFMDLNKNGEYVSYYKNGQIKDKGNYKNGKQDGEREYYYGNNKLEMKGNFKDGKKNGEWSYFYVDGSINKKGNYINDKEEGEWIFFYKNGQIEDKGIFIDGEAYGEWISYYENGQINYEGTYKNGQWDGEFISYYENGQLESKGNVIDGNQIGEWIYYYEDGQIRQKVIYKDGELDGEIIVYYEDGQIQQKKYFKSGKLDGEFTYYYENGEINVEIDFKNGMRNGKYIYYFKDGKITDMNYKDGKKDGKQIGYYEDGSIRFLHDFKDGIGTKSYYNRDGSLLGTGSEIYTDEFDEEIGEYKSIINGLEILYYSNGQTEEISNYKVGELDGTQTLYYENGEIESICNYIYGIKEECANEDTITYHINILSPIPEYTITDRKLNIIGYIEELPDSKALIYIDNNLTSSTIVDSEGNINQSIENINSGKHLLKIIIQDIDGNILGLSDEIKFNVNEENLEINQSLDYNNNLLNIIPDSAEISVKSPIIEGEATNLTITMMKNESKMTNYEGIIFIYIEDENGNLLKPNEYTITEGGIYEFLPTDLGSKEFQKGLEIKKEGTFYIIVEEFLEDSFDDVVLGKEPITVIKNPTKKGDYHVDNYYHVYNYNNDVHNIIPDIAEIEVKDPIIMGEITNLSVTITKNGSQMTDYEGTIQIMVTEEDGTRLKENEYTVPSYGIYTFKSSDLGSKLFQKGLEIKKEGTFYIQVEELNDSGKILGRQKVTVVKN